MSTIKINDNETVELKALSYLHKSSKFEDIEYVDSAENRVRLCFTSKKLPGSLSAENANSRNIVKYWESKHYSTGDVFYTVFYDTGTVMYVKDGSSAPILSIAYPVNTEKSYAEDIFELILSLPESLVKEEQKTYHLVGSFHYAKEVIDYILDHETLSKPTKLAALFSFIGVSGSSIHSLDLESTKKFIANQHAIESAEITKIHDYTAYRNPGLITINDNFLMSIKHTSLWFNTPKSERPKLFWKAFDIATRIALFMALAKQNDRLEQIENFEDPISLLKKVQVYKERNTFSSTISTVAELYHRYKNSNEDRLFKELLSLNKSQLFHLNLVGRRSFDVNDHLIFNAIKRSKLEFTEEAKEYKSFESKCVKDFSLIEKFLSFDDLTIVDEAFIEVFDGKKVIFNDSNIAFYITEAYQRTNKDKFIEILRNLEAKEEEKRSFYYRATQDESETYIRLDIEEKLFRAYMNDTLEGRNFFDFDFDTPFAWILATKDIE